MVELKHKFPDSFFEEKLSCNFYIDKKRKEVWAVELDLLLEFDDVCRKLGLKYYLDSGTLLGAVRDGHFIPWDDDIDVIMLREDYDKLITLGTSQFSFPYFLQCAYTDKGYYHWHAQLRNSVTTGMRPVERDTATYNLGIFIDIFVLDGLPNDSKELERLLEQQRHYKTLLNKICNRRSTNPIKQMLKRVRSSLLQLVYGSSQDVYKRMEENVKKSSNSKYVDKVMFRWSSKDIHILDKRWFEKTQDMLFEGYYFCVPKDYDAVLKEYYGQDYLIPKATPTAHGDIIFDTEKSYLDYFNRSM